MPKSRQPDGGRGGSLGVATTCQAVEECRKFVVFPLSHGVELVLVALGTLHGEPQECGGSGVDAINEVLDAVVLIDDSAFVGSGIVAKKSGSHLLWVGSPRQQIARQLPGNEIAVGQIVVEGGYHPVPPGIDAAGMILEEAVRIPIARHVEPFESHAFSEGRRGQEAANHLLVGIIGFIGEEVVEFRDGGW